jgi:membrane protein YqaA with SNARE-associated domain
MYIAVYLNTMWWQYFLVFIGAFLFDVVPFPLPPAFTVMIFLQIVFALNIWWVIVIGVIGSVLGRYVLTLYIPLLADKILKRSKNEDVQFLGERIKDQGWRGQAAILAYTLLPLPTTPIFLASGMARISAIYVLPMFFVGKFTSDAITVHLGEYASENIENIIGKGFSWPSAVSLLFGLLFLCGILFIDWRSLLIRKKLSLNFRILKRKHGYSPS